MPAAAGVQALTMNSPGLGLDTGPRRRKTTHMQAKEKSEVETNEVYSLSNWYKISVRSHRYRCGHRISVSANKLACAITQSIRASFERLTLQIMIYVADERFDRPVPPRRVLVHRGQAQHVQIGPPIRPGQFVPDRDAQGPGAAVPVGRSAHPR